MRGTRRTLDAGKGRIRFIPAHAGNTLAEDFFLLGEPVHPRACGEHTAPPPHRRAFHGSSPRMRGTQEITEHGAVELRFIPAHAGNTLERRVCPPDRPVHPRACGEHTAPPPHRRAFHGSSPRMRGTQEITEHGAVELRFIPAHAGNTPIPLIDTVPKPVHPRACGEHYIDHIVAGVVFGSSPRMRGTHPKTAPIL